MPDFSDLISQAKKMQEKMKETQEALKKIEVEGVSGGNAVKVIINGDGELKKIDLDDKLLKESTSILNKPSSWITLLIMSILSLILNKVFFLSFSDTAIINLSTNLHDLLIISKCPLVIGSNVPG